MASTYVKLWLLHLSISLLVMPCFGQDLGWIVQLEPSQRSIAWPQNLQPANVDNTQLQLRLVSARKNLYHLSGWTKSAHELLAQPGVLKIERNRTLYSRTTIPNDSQFEQQWSLERIKATQAWDVITGGTTATRDDIVIAVFDDGYDLNHPDLIENIWVNPNEVADDNIDNDSNGYIDDVYGFDAFGRQDNHAKRNHGTSVAGICGAKGNNSIGVSGVNWDIKLLPCSSSGNSIQTEDLFLMYEYVIAIKKAYLESNGARGANVLVANGSLGIQGEPPSEFPIWCDYFEDMGDVGILYVAATTNTLTNVDVTFDMPTNCNSPFLIGVTNTDNDDELANAGYGPKSVDLSAPGNGSFTTRIDNTYGVFGGTSAASPHVAGAIALLYSYPCEEFAQRLKTFPRQTALDMRDFILNNVDPLADLKDSTVSGGRLNIYNSMLDLQSKFCQDIPAGKLVVRMEGINYQNRSITLTMGGLRDLPVKFLITNALGQIIYHETSDLNVLYRYRFELPVNIENSGVYFLTVQQGKEIRTIKFFYM